MKALRFHRYGGAEVLQLDDVAPPSPATGEVSLKVIAAGVNPLDWKIRSGALTNMMPLPLPFILGWDVAGVVAALGDGVSELRVGDAVFGMAAIGAPGAYAEQTVVPAERLLPMPESLTPAQAASMPIVGLTAYQLVFDHGALLPGTSIMILGAAGNVGRLCVMLAANQPGVRVVAVGRAADLQTCHFPAQVEVLESDANNLHRYKNEMDVLVDTVGGTLLELATPCVKPGGRVRSTVQLPAEATAQNISAEMFQVRADRGQLQRVVELFAGGLLSFPDIKEFPLQEGWSAHQQGEAGFHGKLVLLP